MNVQCTRLTIKQDVKLAVDGTFRVMVDSIIAQPWLLSILPKTIYNNFYRL